MKKNYEPWHLTPLTREQFAPLSMYEKLQYLCRLGHLAPNSHNTQPWRFFIDADQALIDVYADRHFILPASDAAGRQAVISIGCALENMIIGASYLSGAPEIEIHSQKKNAVTPLAHVSRVNERYVRLARLHYNSIETKPDEIKPLYQSIFSRKVMRAEFDSHEPIPPAIIRELASATDGKKTKLHVITDSVRRFSVAEFQEQADGFVINSSRFSKELGAWLLPNDTDSGLGMPGIGFGLDDDEAQRIHDGLTGASSLAPEDTLKFALAGKYYIEKSPFIGCITIPKDEIVYWIEAGRSFERMFLMLESAGMSVGVHAGIVEVMLVNRIFGVMLGTLRKPAVLFRAGVVKNEKNKSRPHSPRLPIEEVLLPNSYSV